MWEIINFCLLLLIILVIIFIFVFAIFYYYKIKSYVDDAIDHIGSLIPTFNPYDYNDIRYDYADDMNIADFYGDTFSRELALLSCNINMSTYNIFSGFESRLPKKIKLHHTIGNNCYIYKYKYRMDNSEKSEKLKKLDIRIFSFRGTRTGDDVITDLDSVQSEMSGYPDKILVHRGFYRLWSPYKDDIKSYLKNNCDSETVVLVTGHSLGCAGAIFTSLLVKNYIKNIHLYMFAPPRVGNHHLINKLDAEVPNNYAVINIPDLIPNLPPVTLNTWLYDNFSKRYLMDYQMGSVSLNHRLDTYVCGLNDKQDFCKEPIWKKIPSLITTT